MRAGSVVCVVNNHLWRHSLGGAQPQKPPDPKHVVFVSLSCARLLSKYYSVWWPERVFLAILKCYWSFVSLLVCYTDSNNSVLSSLPTGQLLHGSHFHKK